jgi:hypothetical protein
MNSYVVLLFYLKVIGTFSPSEKSFPALSPAHHSHHPLPLPRPPNYILNDSLAHKYFTPFACHGSMAELCRRNTEQQRALRRVRVRTSLEADSASKDDSKQRWCIGSYQRFSSNLSPISFTEPACSSSSVRFEGWLSAAGGIEAVGGLGSQTKGVGPPARGGCACASVGSRVVYFGGADRAAQAYNDVWVLETGDASTFRHP